MTEQDLHDYNKWLMEVWNPKQLYIPFAIDAPNAYLTYRKEQLIIADVVGRSEQLADDKSYQPCDGCNTSCKEWEIFFCKKLG